MFAFTLGYTPQETAYELMGLAHCGAGVDWIMGTMLPKAFFILGTIIVVKRSMIQKGNLWPIFGYGIGVLLMLALFVWGSVGVSPDSAVSAREAAGVKMKATTAEILKAKDANGGKGNVSAGFIVIIRGIDGLINGFIGKIEQVTLRDSSKGMFVKPMAYLQAFYMLNAMNIENSVTRAQFTNFVAKCTMPALKKLKDEDTPRFQEATKDFWPGQTNLRDVYRSKGFCNKEGEGEINCATEWTALRAKLLAEATGQQEKAADKAGIKSVRGDEDKLLKEFSKKLMGKSEIQAQIMKGMLEGSSEVAGDTVGQQQWAATGRGLNRIGAWWGKITGAVTIPMTLGGWAIMAIQVLPVFRGFLLMVAYSFFPLILLFSFLPDGWGAIKKFFITVLWLKTWSLVWALINIGQIFGVCMLMAMGGGGQSGMEIFSNSLVFPIVTFLAIISSPIIAGLIVHASLDALGGAVGMVKGPLVLPK